MDLFFTVLALYSHTKIPNVLLICEDKHLIEQNVQV